MESTAATNTPESTAATKAAAGSTAAVEGASAGPAGAEGAAAPAIELAELRRQFGDLPALSGVSLTLPAGQSLAVLGQNGSGKSTLLRILAGLLRPSGGAVSVLGCSLPKETYGLRGRVGYLGHEPLLYRDLTPRENLALVAALYGIEAERRIDELLEAVRMSHRADDRVAAAACQGEFYQFSASPH